MIYQEDGMNKFLKLYKNRIEELKLQRDNEAARHQDTKKEFHLFQQYIYDLFDSITDTIFMLDNNFNFFFLNKKTEHVFGRNKEELIGKSPFDLFPDLRKKKEYQEFLRAADEKVAVDFEYYSAYIEQWFDVNIFPYHDDLFVSARNITERKEAEEAFRESQQIIADIINFLPDATIVIDCSGKVIAWNRAAEELTGIQEKDILGQDNYAYSLPFYGKRRPLLVDLVLNPDEHWEQDYQEIFRKGNVLIGERNYSLAGISGLYLRGTAAPLYDSQGNIIGAIECISDISNHRKTEQALRASEEMYRRIIETANEGIWLVDPNHKTTLVNQKMADMLGYTIDEMIGTVLFDFLDEEWTDIAKIHSQLRPKGIIETYEVKYRCKNDDTIWTLSSIAPLFDKNGCFSGSLGMITDITDRKITEEKLRASEEMYRRIVETANEGIGITDDHGIVIFTNKKLAEMLGYEPDELIGMSLSDCIFDFDDKKCSFDNYMERRQQGIKETINIRYRCKDDSCLWALVSVQPIMDDNGHYIGSLGMVTDLSEIKKLEMEVAHLDRLNLVGEIAASIGHEIRNPMTAVRGFLQILGINEQYSEDKEHFDLMIEELDRANLIISEFLSLANNRIVKLELHDLNDIITAILPLIQAEAVIQEKYISIHLKTIPDLFMDEREIRQLIINLVRNGLEAMQSGATLTIKTFSRDEEIVLTIEDQGSGLDESISDKIGTPFITTKENGTGLGLPVCYSIAARHNARISFKTSPEGTIFYVIFSTVY